MIAKLALLLALFSMARSLPTQRPNENQTVTEVEINMSKLTAMATHVDLLSPIALFFSHTLSLPFFFQM